MAGKLNLARYLDKLPLERLGDDRPAGLWITSLPVSAGAGLDLGLGKRATHVKPLGQWPGASGPKRAPSPRRLLMIADAAGQAPTTIQVTPAAKPRKSKGGPVGAAVPEARAELFANAKTADYYWERHMLRIQWNGRWVGLAMGLRFRGEVHWWEYAHMVSLSESPTCREVEMGGAIPCDLTDSDPEVHKQFGETDDPYPHRHNWVNGHIYARLHANGVCEVYARHINSHFFDMGADFKDAVPVLGIRVEGGESTLASLAGTWDGSKQDLQVGRVKFDMSDVAHLATPEQPGRLDVADGFLVLQPYMGVQQFSGRFAKSRTGDPYLWHAEDRTMPRGMARTLRFSLSLNDDRPARVVRDLAPSWWYGLCNEFQAGSLLPVSTDFDAAILSVRQWLRTYIVQGGFEDGQIPNQSDNIKERRPPAVEGDLPGMFIQACYRSHDAAEYDLATRACYNFIDTFIDHAAKHVRMQDFTVPALALPLQRIHSCISAWLEHGDQFCLDAGKAVIDRAYGWHKNSWPRMAVGRDACFVHSAMMLYRYLADEHFLAIARDGMHDVAASQWPDGTFGDQAGGAGTHGRASYIIKPWMGCLATMGMLDYLEMFPGDPEAMGVVTKFVNWLMTRARGPRAEGKVGWTYMYPFMARETPGVTQPPWPGAEARMSHYEYMARLLPYWSFHTGDPAYFDAYAQSYEGVGSNRQGGYWTGVATMLFVSWLQTRLWNARPDADGTIRIEPVFMGPRTPRKALITTPKGEVEVGWTEDGKLVLPRGGKVKIKAKPRVLLPRVAAATISG